MSARRITQFTLLSIVALSGALLLWSGGGGSASESTAPASVTESTAEAPAEGRVLVATYFHGDRRCETCRTIEQQCTDTIEQGFPAAIARGRLVFRKVNIDRPENAHYVRDFGLTHSTLVLADTVDSEVQRHVALDRVWELVWEPGEFDSYVRTAVDDWLSSRPSR